MLRIITDSAADITRDEADKLGISVVPLSITFPDGDCPQETEEDIAEFYRRLATCKELPTTSQVPLDTYLRHYEAAQKAGDDVLVLTLSGGLSGTVQSANSAKQLCGYDRIFVLDSFQAISAQRILVEHAAALRDRGCTVEEIIEELTSLRNRVTVSGVIDTLEYLKKGGRIPASLAILGTTLHLKPVIALQNTKLVTIGKAVGRKAGLRMLHERMEKYPPDPAFPILFGYSSNRELTEEFMRDTLEKYNLSGFETRLCPVGGVIGTHVGTNCVALCYVSQINVG